ncbi:hypothetical protein [Candidatus Entotheonella palauensis]|uniref:Pentapeptide repeat-containing protein n=1 Tax=Candidatus Entotheonella gemina TaxID=1429439 RepID=W4M1F9_9BACT|nr:hypothetical protein [Candidatus Entotheonella palauensis]ETX04030.1 MAG: hypothetical protein ETSY2_31135 [Candidatus Entotheonella gemina]
MADIENVSISGQIEIREERAQIEARIEERALQEKRERNRREERIFSKACEVDFRQMTLEKPEMMIFIEADLRRCRFLDSDLRQCQLSGIEWPSFRGRRGVYDEKKIDKKENPSWERVEQLYRELKQNYEDRRDYERASDFHYGEKEMRRQNPSTPWNSYILLTLYWLVSGYGERFLRPLIWAGVLLIMSTLAYLHWGLIPAAKIATGLPGEFVLKGDTMQVAWSDWPKALDFSFRTMAFLKPTDFVPREFAKVVYTIQSLLGPLFFGLLALAVRQRLKR